MTQGHIFSQEIPTLLETHFQHLHRDSGISVEVIKGRGYQSIASGTDLEKLGFAKYQCRVPGILIPLWGVDGQRVGYVYRPDKPRSNSKGKLVKYENKKGSSLRIDCPPKCQGELGDPSIDLFVTEGSKKADALASRGVCAISLNGVWGFKGRNKMGGITLLIDWDRIALNGRRVYIAFDSDVMVKPEVQRALHRLTEHLRRKGACVFHVILPSHNEGKIGVDDYLREHCLDDIYKLAAEAPIDTHSHPAEDTLLINTLRDIDAGLIQPKKAVLMLRDLPDVKPYLRRWLVSKVAIEVLTHYGRLIKNSEGRFYFHASTKQLFELGSFEFGTLLNDLFGLNQTEQEFRFALAEINTEAHLRGQPTEVHRFSFYDRHSNILYIDRFDGWMYCLDAQKVQLVENATDGVLFAKEQTWQPYQYINGGYPDGLLNEILVDDIPFQRDSFAPLTPDEQRMVFSLWVFSLFFESLLPTKPILAIVGEKGSGKTTALRRVLRLLLGVRADVVGLERGKEDAFIAAITHGYLVVFDNLDGKIPWINDRLALAATSSLIERRRLYTTNEVAIYQPKCFVALTSRNPHFRRDDVVDRLILLKVDRLVHFRPESEMLMTVDSQRDLLWTELLNDLNSIVACLAQSSGRPQAELRMSDWAALCWRIAKQQGIEDSFDAILYKLSVEQLVDLNIRKDNRNRSYYSFGLKGVEIYDEVTR